MRHFIILILSLLASQPILAQTTVPPTVDLQKATLTERFQIMKSRSETYNEYKVIKENVLDGVLRIVMDTISRGKVQLHESAATISRLEGDLKNTQEALRQKEASFQDLVYASTHISVLGINVEKTTFLTIVSVIIIGLGLLLGVLTGKLKLVYSSIREKIELVNATLYELDEYKRKSLDKQTKLSRELQNERNKLMELRRS